MTDLTTKAYAWLQTKIYTTFTDENGSEMVEKVGLVAAVAGLLGLVAAGLKSQGNTIGTSIGQVIDRWIKAFM